MRRRLRGIAAWILIAGLCMCSIQAGATEGSGIPVNTADETSKADETPKAGETPKKGETDLENGSASANGADLTEGGSKNTGDGEDLAGEPSFDTDETNAIDGNLTDESSADPDIDGVQNQRMIQLLADNNAVPADCGSVVSTMPFSEGSQGELLFLTLVDNRNYRWNINGSGVKGNEAHLDDVEGENCTFRLTHVEDEWYGIKYIKDKGTDRYVDVDGKSMNDGAVLHIFEDSDNKLKNDPHRQFAFYDAGTDSVGNRMYYIKVRKSGLWVGLEHNTIATHQKLVQTSADKARRWYITPCVVPQSGNECALWPRGSKVFCEIFKKNSTNMGAVNVMWKEGSAEINGMLLNNFELGSHSKWMLSYEEKYDAYYIESVNQASNRGVYPSGNVWDVSSESGKDTNLNLWEWQSKDRNYNTSQLWRFIGTSSDNVIIQNARSGRYAYFNENILRQGSNGEHFEISLISEYVSKDRSAFLPDGASKSTSDSMNWMSRIPDSALLSSINIPGTHDTGTAGIVEDQGFVIFDALSLSQCQKYYYEEQLTVGIRSFDIRCSANSKSSKADDVMIIHGSSMWQCFNRWGEKLNLLQILNTSKEFLAHHSTETIVMTVAKNDGEMSGLIHALAEYMKDNPNLFWQSDKVPTMGEARGKIVLISRFSVKDSDIEDEPGVEVSWFGPQLDDWDDHDYGAKQGLVDISGDSGCLAYAQDAYNEWTISKEKYIEGAINDSSGGTIPGNAYIWNYTSSALGFPLELTRDINLWLWKNRGTLFHKGRMGMVMLNFADIMLSRETYESNYGADFFATGCTFPETVEVTYGETMSEARLGGQSGDGTFTVDDEDRNYRPVVDDAGKKEVTIRFIPNNPNMRPVTQKVMITSVLPRPVTVTVPAQTYEYGEDVNLIYNVNDGQLAEGDTAESLGIALTPQCGAKTGSGRVPAGVYDISYSDNNKNYTFTYDLNKVTVTPKTVTVTWSETTNIVKGTPDEATWEKQGANVHVDRIDGVLDGDKCSAAVTGGNEKEASWKGNSDVAPVQYTASVSLTGDDAGNYKITENTQKKYYIRRPDADDYCLPESAAVVYGQQLSEAVLDGASGDGEFIFYPDKEGIHIENITSIEELKIAIGAGVDVMNEVPGDVKTDGTTYYYSIWYQPKDSAENKGSGKRVPVTVLPKPITVNVSSTTKVYGDSMDSVDYSYDREAVAEQLVKLDGNDPPDSLGLTLKAYDGDAEVTDRSPAGIYPIRGTATNTNYAVTVKPGMLKITCKAAELIWTGYEKLSYTGQPVNVTASVSNLLFGDTCDVEVVGGQRTNAGTYTAVAVRLGNSNYKLTQNSKLSQSYTIGKAVPIITWPAVSLTYGQALAEGGMSGGRADAGGTVVDGEFVFDNENIMPAVAESNTPGYGMTFYPADTTNYESVSGTIPVIVNPKPLTIQMLNKEKIYGDELAASDLPVYYNKSELVGGDTLTIRPIVTDGTNPSVDPTYADAGTHIITVAPEELRQSNPNYNITVQEGILTVQKRPVILEWSDVSNIVYEHVDGQKDAERWKQVGADVTASISNLVKRPGSIDGDDCRVVVVGGDAKEPSDQSGSGGSKVTIYHAVAEDLEGAQSGNYTFSEEKPDVPTEPLKNIDAYQNSRLKPYVIRMSENCILPFAAVATYGKPLADARMLAGSGNGTFEIVDKDGRSIDAAAKIDAGIYADTYKVKFTPNEQGKETVTSNGYITLLVRKAPITVTAQDTSKNYGDGKPDYIFRITSGELAAGDRLEDLLTARSVLYEHENEEDSSEVTGEVSGDEETSGIGVYDIVLEEQKNMNYDLTFQGAQLIIDPRPVEIVWSDTSHIVYGYVNGEKNLEEWQKVGANVTAVSKNLVEGDSCNLTCAGGNRKNAGTYWAIVTGLDNPNYRLPLFANVEEYENTRMLRYTILKADPEVVFPNLLYARQGEVLGGLSYNGSADVPGTFAFEAADTVLRRSGNYKMIFTPDDIQNYNTAEAMVKVIVSGKPGGNDTDDNNGNNDNNNNDNNNNDSNNGGPTDDGNGGSGTNGGDAAAGMNGANGRPGANETDAGSGGANGSGAKKARAPMTSDNSLTALYAILILLSFATVMTMTLRKKRV